MGIIYFKWGGNIITSKSKSTYLAIVDSRNKIKNIHVSKNIHKIPNA